MQKYGGGGRVAFLVVYVMEAHAKREWPLGHSRSSTLQHRTLADRLAAAQKYQRLNKFAFGYEHIFFTVDTMDNCFYSQFGAWPETHLVIDGEGRLVLRTESDLGEGTIHGGEWDELVEGALEKLLQ